MTIETIFLGHDNKRPVMVPSKLLDGVDIEIGEEVQCPRCEEWTYFEGHSHGQLNQCSNGCGLWYGTLGTMIRLTDEQHEVKSV